MEITRFGCVEKKPNGAIETQLWMEFTPEQGDARKFRFVVRNVDLSAGGRRCELDSGFRARYEDALAAGQAALQANLQPAESVQAEGIARS